MNDMQMAQHIEMSDADQAAYEQWNEEAAEAADRRAYESWVERQEAGDDTSEEAYVDYLEGFLPTD